MKFQVAELAIELCSYAAHLAQAMCAQTRRARLAAGGRGGHRYSCPAHFARARCAGQEVDAASGVRRGVRGRAARGIGRENDEPRRRAAEKRGPLHAARWLATR